MLFYYRFTRSKLSIHNKIKIQIDYSFFDIDLTDIDMNLIKGFPITIRNCHENDIFETNISVKNVSMFLKKHQVPYYLKNICPVILFNNKVIYSPFYKDILNKKSFFSLPYIQSK